VQRGIIKERNIMDRLKTMCVMVILIVNCIGMENTQADPFGDEIDIESLDRGHRILLERGLQLQATVLDTTTFDLETWEASNFTTPDFWAIPLAPQFLAPIPGILPWARWTTWWTNELDFLTPAEQPYEHTFVSIHHGDEIDLSDPANVQKIADLLAQLRILYPDTISFHNESAEISSFSETQNMMAVAHPDIIHAGSYPFGDKNEEYEGGSPTKLYETFERYRTLSLLGHDGTGANPIPYGMFIQTFHDNDRWERPPTTSEVTLQQFAAWAFGCKMTNAFIYNSNTPVHGELISALFNGDGDSSPTPFFLFMAELNAQSRRLGPALVRLISTEVFMKMGRHEKKHLWWKDEDNDLPSGVPEWSEEADPGHLVKLDVENLNYYINSNLEGDVIIGYFKVLHEDFDGPDANNEIYFMVVNGLSDHSAGTEDTRQEIRLIFDFGATGITSLQRLNKNTGHVDVIPLEHLEGSQYLLTLTLNGGEGILFKYNTGAPFVGFYPEPSWFGIRSDHSGKVLDIYNFGRGLNVQQWDYHGSDNQLWNLQDAGDGYLWFQSRYDPRKALSTDGANILVWDYVGHPLQQWSAVELGNGHYQLVNRYTAKVLNLDVSGPERGYNNGDNVQIGDSHGGSNQSWSVLVP
jgi:hypothetical protein